MSLCFYQKILGLLDLCTVKFTYEFWRPTILCFSHFCTNVLVLHSFKMIVKLILTLLQTLIQLEILFQYELYYEDLLLGLDQVY